MYEATPKWFVSPPGDLLLSIKEISSYIDISRKLDGPNMKEKSSHISTFTDSFALHAYLQLLDLFIYKCSRETSLVRKLNLWSCDLTLTGQRSLVQIHARAVLCSLCIWLNALSCCKWCLNPIWEPLWHICLTCMKPELSCLHWCWSAA